MTLHAPLRTAPEDEMEERGDESALLICTLAMERASLEPMLLASSKSEAGTLILGGLIGGDVEDEGVAESWPARPESAEEVCADWDEEEPEETCTVASVLDGGWEPESAAMAVGRVGLSSMVGRAC